MRPDWSIQQYGKNLIGADTPASLPVASESAWPRQEVSCTPTQQSGRGARTSLWAGFTKDDQAAGIGALDRRMHPELQFGAEIGFDSAASCGFGLAGTEPQPAGYMTGADRPARAGLCCLSSSRRVLGLANALPWGLVERTGTVSDGSGYLTERSRGTGTASTSLPCVPWRYHLLRMRPVAGAGAMIDRQEAGGADRSQMDEDADRIGLGRQGKRSRSCPMAAETMRFGSRAA
jgi:hypothetical protein